MRDLNRKTAGGKQLLFALIGVSALAIAGCNSERDDGDGDQITTVVLPADVVLGLFCEDAGVFPETCILDDPANPFALTTIPEFNEDDPDALSKFDLANQIPAGPGGAKSRFYFWATALARRPSGENQYFTALALHEVFDANSNAISEDELIREQALKAYRSVLDNFFNSVVVFECTLCGADEDGNFPQFTVPLNERVADHLFRTESTNFVKTGGLRRLVPTEIGVLDLFVDWGYSYQPANPPNYDDGVVSPAEF